jgi:uncharacterized RDD family membrane protein YckC
MDTQASQNNIEYVGFWARVGASIIDSLLVGIITAPFLLHPYAQENIDYLFEENHIAFQQTIIVGGFNNILISYVLPAIAIIIFWIYKQASPGKMAISAKIIDATSGKPPSVGQCILRYIGYFVSALPFCMGFLWIAFSPKKQGWHDIMANTVVIRSARHDQGFVSFKE